MALRSVLGSPFGSSSPSFPKWAPFVLSLIVSSYKQRSLHHFSWRIAFATPSSVSVTTDRLPAVALAQQPSSVKRQREGQQRQLHKKQGNPTSRMGYETASERLYAPYRKHPQLFGDNFRDEWLHPDMQEIMKRLQSDQDREFSTQQGKNMTTATLQLLAPYLNEEAWQIYSFQCLSSSFLQLFREELAHFSQICQQHDIPVQRPNSSKFIKIGS